MNDLISLEAPPETGEKFNDSANFAGISYSTCLGVFKAGRVTSVSKRPHLKMSMKGPFAPHQIAMCHGTGRVDSSY